MYQSFIVVDEAEMEKSGYNTVYLYTKLTELLNM